ncbi:GntR family transcriptional regulator [Marivibrio halodurans]|uniref:GntR family transcriptional regulator n=1 Tax=Marivibrio halodurans TaxID=2039722 RepID=A0A8J7SPN9_9PROT|nr:GntR family transcriptional regulator [Marivibrio halodurans]MBP5858753.1 GntR family transcriptional regulator [Marivibrio halodurans]
MPLAPVETDRQTLSEVVHARLLDAICAGELAPGESLVQERLAETLGVSRQPVLQALAMLRRDGFVEPAGRRGYRVTVLTDETVGQVYELRGALDRLAAGAAARRAGPDAKARLEAVMAEGEAALADGDTRRLIEADVAFHQAIYKLARNPLVEEAAAQPWRHIRRVMGLVLRETRSRRAVWDEHRRIVDAILAGDVTAAEEAASRHAAHAAERMLAQPA